MGKINRLTKAGELQARKPREGKSTHHQAKAPKRPLIFKTKVDPAKKAPPFKSKGAKPLIEPVIPAETWPIRGKCMFPYGDTKMAGWGFCGRDGNPWCAEHREIVFQPQHKARAA